MNRRHSTFIILGLSIVIIVGCSRIQKANATQLAATQSGKEGGAQAPPAAGKTGSTPAPAPALKPESLPEVVAEVNGQTVKKTELLDQIKAVEAQMGSVNPEKKSEFIRAVLDDIIAQRLLLQEAQSRKLTPSKEEMDKQLSAFKKQFPDEATFNKALQSEGLTEDQLKQKVGDQLTMEKYIETVIVPKVTVNDAEVQKFYDSNKDKMKEPEQVKASHILIRVAPDADAKAKKEARDKAEGLLKRVRAKEDFAALAKANSDDPGSKENGGNLDYFAKGQMVPEFDKAVWNMKKDEISDIVETQFGYHIIKVIDHKPEQVVPFDTAKEQIKTFLKRRGVSENLQTTAKDLKAKGKVKVMI